MKQKILFYGWLTITIFSSIYMYILALLIDAIWGAVSWFANTPEEYSTPIDILIAKYFIVILWCTELLIYIYLIRNGNYNKSSLILPIINLTLIWIFI